MDYIKVTEDLHPLLKNLIRKEKELIFPFFFLHQSTGQVFIVKRNKENSDALHEQK